MKMHFDDLYHILPVEAQKQSSYIWEQTLPFSFQELVLGWNASRPLKGHYHFSISIKMDTWSPWFSYAVWEPYQQRSFRHQWNSLHIFQDTVNISDAKATGWRLKVESSCSDPLTDFYALYASLPLVKEPSSTTKLSFICLEVPPLSQLQIQDPRHMRICSPTSTTAAMRFLNPQLQITPLEFADKVWDNHFDIYGHWVFSTAQAFVELGQKWQTRVMHLSGFEQVHQLLKTGTPVVVSVKGPLSGTLHPYNEGHLLVIRGYDPVKNQVLCMDPAYPQDAETKVAYNLRDFLLAWQRRKNIAYVFKPLVRL